MHVTLNGVTYDQNSFSHLYFYRNTLSPKVTAGNDRSADGMVSEFMASG